MERTTLDERITQAFKKYRGDNKHLVVELKKFLKEAEAAGDVHYIGKLNMHIAGCYFDLGNRVKILPYALKAVNIFENSDNRSLLARSYNILGIAYHAQGKYQLSIEAYNKALEAIRGLKKPGIGRDLMLNNTAQCYYQMGEFRKSVRLVRECLAYIRKKRPDDHASAVIYGINLSESYESLEDYKSAIESLDDVSADLEKIDQNNLIWGYYARRCIIMFKLGDVKEGLKYADLTYDYVINGTDSYEGHLDFEKISKQEVRFGEYERAQRFADILIKYAEKNGHTLDQIISKRVQANISYAVGEEKRALELYRELNDLYEKRMNEDNVMQYESQRNAEAATREITKLMRKVRDSEEKAERDALTGLLNRSALVNIAEEFLRDARNNGKKLGGIFLDIDYFKEYNDTYGHAEGDLAIKYIADVCKGEESSQMKFFRYGGDEFFGIVLGWEDKDLEAAALRISEAIRASGIAHVKNPNGQRLTVSIGIVNVDMKGSDETILDIIKYADKALYHAKDRGKDDVFAYHNLPNAAHEYERVER